MIFDLLVKNRAYIEAALEYNNTHVFDDVAAGVLTGRYQLWEMDSGCMVTEIVTYPRRKVVNVFLGGGDLAETMAMHDRLEAWAHEIGAQSLTVSGRHGWARILPKYGWEKQHMTMEKRL